MGVHKAGHDDHARAIDHLRAVGVHRACDRFDLPVLDQNISLIEIPNRPVQRQDDATLEKEPMPRIAGKDGTDPSRQEQRACQPQRAQAKELPA